MFSGYRDIVWRLMSPSVCHSRHKISLVKYWKFMLQSKCSSFESPDVVSGSVRQQHTCLNQKSVAINKKCLQHSQIFSDQMEKTLGAAAGIERNLIYAYLGVGHMILFAICSGTTRKVPLAWTNGYGIKCLKSRKPTMNSVFIREKFMHA